jgi:hypothetical protein
MRLEGVGRTVGAGRHGGTGRVHGPQRDARVCSLAVHGHHDGEVQLRKANVVYVVPQLVKAQAVGRGLNDQKERRDEM